MTMILKVTTLVAAIFLAGLTPSYSGQIYKWVDENGVTHFSDSPTDASMFEEHDTETRPSYEAHTSMDETDQTEEIADKSDSDASQDKDNIVDSTLQIYKEIAETNSNQAKVKQTRSKNQNSIVDAVSEQQDTEANSTEASSTVYYPAGTRHTTTNSLGLENATYLQKQRDYQKKQKEYEKRKKTVKEDNAKVRAENERKQKKYENNLREYKANKQAVDKHNAKVKAHNDMIKRNQHLIDKKRAQQKYQNRNTHVNRDNRRKPYLKGDYVKMMNNDNGRKPYLEDDYVEMMNR